MYKHKTRQTSRFSRRLVLTRMVWCWSHRQS